MKVNVHKKQKSSFIRRNMYDIKAWLLILPTLVLMFFMIYRPIATGFWNSLHTMQGYTVLDFCGLDNYRNVLKDGLFISSFVNSLKYVGWSFVFGYLPPIILALMLNEIIKCRNAMRFAVYLPSVVPMMVCSMLWYLIFYPNQSGMMNMLLGKLGMDSFIWLENPKWTIPLIIITTGWHGIGSTAVFYMAALQGVNRELYEAAAIDGMGLFDRLRKVTLPEIYPVALLFMVRQLISLFQIMQEPLTMTGGGPNNASLSMSLLGYRYGFVYYQTGRALALGVIQFLMLIGFTVFYFYLQKKIKDNA